ncbi:MAG: hypothetical protein Q7R93_05085 [bacterium]|nr:hypothetical protein [bacterium]
MRIIADVLLIVAVFLLPWWLTLSCAAVLFFVFDRYYELFFTALLLDLLYAAPLERFAGFEFALALISVPLLVALSFVKKRMRLSTRNP